MIVRALALGLVFALSGCNKDDGATATDSGTGTSSGMTTGMTGTTDTTGMTGTTGVTGTGTTGMGTTGMGTMGMTGTGTTGVPTTGATAGSTGDEGTGTGTTTGGNVSGFERFMMSSAAGPCPPNEDCDGFVELLASGMLRVETFGDVTNTVKEVEISAEDFAAAVPVFADPALVALLGGADPVCDPPTDIFESMLVEIDGVTHDASTTACEQPPIVAARKLANDLRMQYVP